MVINVSLIMCTKNRGNRLKATFDHIAAIDTDHSWELILVDNNSTDDTREILDAFAMAHPEIVVCCCACALPGNGAGRNAGVEMAEGEILSFVDDDCYVAPDHIDAVVRLFSDLAIHFAGGRILLHDPTDAPLTINEATEAIPVAPGGWVQPFLVQGANLMIRRSSFAAVGGFDPLFGAGATFTGEDADLCTTLNCCGYGGGYFPSPTVRHHHGRKVDGIYRHKRAYAIGYGALFAKHLLFAGHFTITVHALVQHVHWALRHGEGWDIPPLAVGFFEYIASRTFRRLDVGTWS